MRCTFMGCTNVEGVKVIGVNLTVYVAYCPTCEPIALRLNQDDDTEARTPEGVDLWRTLAGKWSTRSL